MLKTISVDVAVVGENNIPDVNFTGTPLIPLPSGVHVLERSLQLGVPNATESVEYDIKFLITTPGRFFASPFILWSEPPGSSVPTGVSIGVAQPGSSARECRLSVSIVPHLHEEGKEFQFFFFIKEEAGGDIRGRSIMIVADPTIVTDPDPDRH